MWILLTFAMLALTLVVYRVLTRIKHFPSQVFCFLCAGCPVGILHIGLSFSAFGYTEETLAAILVYAASCEFILNLFSLVANGVSVSVLEQLSKGPTDLHTLDVQYSTNTMVTRRINQLQRDGFLIKQHGKLQLTSKGQMLVQIFLRLRTFFGHKALLKKTLPYLQRQQCPGCFTSSQKATLEVQSAPPAEELPPEKHGKFLSGYTSQRVFFSYYRCSSCTLLYCPTYFTQEQLDSLYKNQSENMAEAPLKARARTQKAYYDLLKKHHASTGDYLEIGADIGLFAKFFAENVQANRLFLYEPNCKIHDTLKKNMGNSNYKIITKNYAAADIAANTLATAVIIHALDHVLNPRQLMQEIYQHLKPGGVVFIVTHDESSLLTRVLRKKWPPFTLQHPHLFRPSTIQALLKAEGFNILASKKTANYFPLTHFIKGGLTAIGLNKIPIPHFPHFIIPIRLGNIATIAQKPFGATE